MIATFNVAHFFCAAYMTGIIWFVQKVHYPMLHLSNGSEATSGHKEYTQRMGAVVMPIMLSELGLQTYWIFKTPSQPIAWICAALLLIIWCSTFCLQVPCHHKLQSQFDPQIQKRLVQSNWIRTLAWTTRALLLAWVLT